MRLRRHLLLATVFMGASAAALPAFADDAASLEELVVTARRENRTSKGATGLDLSLTETPQAVTVIDRDFMDVFGLDDANSVLSLTPGVNVEEVETDRTYYNARGFDIRSMQIDGVGLPFTWNVAGDLDVAGYEKIEAVHGANGLLTGTGNPSGTINYVRKRPTNAFQGAAELTAGSWDRFRGEVDVSGPFSASGRWAGRLVAAAEDRDSWLDQNHSERTFFYGVVEGQIGDNAILTAGYTQQDSASKGVLWGALPLLYTDGTQAEWDVSTTTTMEWTKWDIRTRTSFVELVYELPMGWEAKGTLTYNDFKEPSRLFYTYGTPDRATGLGLYGYPGAYDQANNSTLFDGVLSGPIELGGKRHDLVLGVTVAKSQSGYLQYAAPADDPAWGALPPVGTWDGDEIAEPAWGPPTQAANFTNRFNRVYGAAHLDFGRGVKAVAGFNAIDVKTRGDSFGASMRRDEQAVSPYLGATWTFTRNLTLYGSYSDIFEPQAELDENLEPLGAAKGESWEGGLKGEWFDGRLYTSIALFKAEQDNYPEAAGMTPAGITFYRGIMTRSKGVELEAAGRLPGGVKVQGGFTQLEIEGEDGADVRTYVPRRTFVLGAVWEVPVIDGLEVGGTVKWQDDIHLDAALGTIRQDAYAIVNLVASYDLTDAVKATVRVNNVTDEKRLTSLYWEQAFYGAPRNVSVSLSYAF
ncbi:TonB-dependent siderophore receptor [Phenylobacterium sp.]|uniref:TonB-dependent siderophore receptor n=1 Tax=Phenylobacterium sp. TaxID=1871053 RepID=UPI003931DF0A